MNAAKTKPAGVRRGGAAGVADQDGDRDDRVARERDDQQEPEDPVHPVVAEDGQGRGQDRGDDGDQGRVPAERPVQPAGQQHLVGHVEGHVGEQHGEQRDHDAAVAELGPGLDHLGQAEHRALGGVERHEQRAEPDAEHAGQDRPAQGQAQGGADEADRDREVLEVAQEPEHGLLPDLAVAFGVGDPVDRVHLDLAEQAAPLFFLDGGFPGLCGHRRLLLAPVSRAALRAMIDTGFLTVNPCFINDSGVS